MKTGVLLINLGSPDKPNRSSVKRYLRQFLNDARVIDISPIARWLLVNLIIAPFRSGRSAKLYKSIWTEKGSPLKLISQEFSKKLSIELGDAYAVSVGMRYGSPSIEFAVEQLRHQNIQQLIILPMYPQYASSTTGSSIQEAFQHLGKWNTIPHINVISDFYAKPEFIDAFVSIGSTYNPLSYDHVIFSFHGLPERHIHKADQTGHCLMENCCAGINSENSQCYRASCFETARQIATGLAIPADKFTISFQSRLGRTPWIKPYTEEVIKHLAKNKNKRILIFSPSFVADCLETLHEIAIEYNALFQHHGGESVHLVESLNVNPQWVHAVAKWIKES